MQDCKVSYSEKITLLDMLKEAYARMQGCKIARFPILKNDDKTQLIDDA